MSPTATYRPRHPERTPFYQCLEDYWDEFKESYPYFYEAEYGPSHGSRVRKDRKLLGRLSRCAWISLRQYAQAALGEGFVPETPGL